jgi:protoheme IX farnesyltransferase
MKTATTVVAEAAPLARVRLADYVALVKPRVSVMVLLTVAAGYLLGTAGTPDWTALLHTLLGTALVAVGASAWNQVLERDTDALMRRTEGRPLPSGRLQPTEVAILGSLLAVGGVAYLAAALSQPLAALVAGLTWFGYVGLYTPLKRKTSLNTLIGAVPGALPPVIGWAAARGSLGAESLALFLILFLWQVPHFLAIAWIYRDEYGRAGLRMLPVVDRGGGLTGRQMVGYCLALVPASLTPLVCGRAGLLYLTGALVLGVAFLLFALAFLRRPSLRHARGVLRASLVYLPLLLSLLLLDGMAR